MGFFEKLGLDSAKVSVDWELIPSDTFGMFESWGGKERVRNRHERFYYFFIDAAKQPATIYLMERGIKHAKIMARIKAPQSLIDRCVASQGKGGFDFSYAIDSELKSWLYQNVVEAKDFSRVEPLAIKRDMHPEATGLPAYGSTGGEVEPVVLRAEPVRLSSSQVPLLIKEKNLYDRRYNPEGTICSRLYDCGDHETVADLASGLMWQRCGSEINSIKTIESWVRDLNRRGFAGFNDWRLPTIEEALSVLTRELGANGQYLHKAFSKEQPFIFTADQRHPGGRWFVDCRQGTTFWASAFNPGGFGRVCRTAVL